VEYRLEGGRKVQEVRSKGKEKCVWDMSVFENINPNFRIKDILFFVK
jgi:hypothetical protein